MDTFITPVEVPHFAALREALDVVAREKRYLAFTQAPPPEVAFALYRHIVEHQLCLMQAAVGGPWVRSMKRVELTVRCDNTRARRLY